ncbi:MAG: alanine racemase [Candidatus Omnitrophica bacterium]|nr:alanine racemase [Candidatus Omnitrophota bacterium]
MKGRYTPPQAWVEIDLKAVLHNYNEIRKIARRQLEPRRGRAVDILSVVKADAYGHGMLEVAGVIAKEGGAFFAVSNAEEGVMLRKRLGKKPRILLFEATIIDLIPHLIKYDLTPAVCTMDFTCAYDKAAARRGRRLPVHVKIDTGMGRMGVHHTDAVGFIQGLSAFKHLKVEGLFTHFPLADTDEAFTCAQMDDFAKVVSGAIERGIAFTFLHAANSMGLSGYKNRLFNLARPGVMLYGLYPSENVRMLVSLKPVMCVKATVLLLKTIAAGSGVSYGHTFKAPRDIPVAVVSIGYSDGYLRALSNKAAVLLNGVRCPVLGRVTMDQIVVDITQALDVGQVNVGDEAVVMGRQGRGFISADELAEWAGTIHYEITCSLGNRLPRVMLK